VWTDAGPFEAQQRRRLERRQVDDVEELVIDSGEAISSWRVMKERMALTASEGRKVAKLGVISVCRSGSRDL
jgi:hypothetical protein